MFNKKNKEFSPSVSVGFFGILLIVSLLFNVALFLRIQNIPDGISEYFFPQSETSRAAQMASRAEDNRIIVGNDVWVRLSDPRFDIIYLKDENCTHCADLTTIQNDLAQNFLSANTKTVNMLSEEGQQIIEEGGISVVPAIVLSAKFAETAGAPALAQNGLVTQLPNGQFEFRTPGNKRILNPEQLPATSEAVPGTVTIVGFIDYLTQDIGTYLNAMLGAVASQYPENVNIALLPFVNNVASLAAAEAFLCGVDIAQLDAVKANFIPVAQGILSNNQQVSEESIAQVRQSLADLLQLEGDTLTCYNERQPDEQITQATVEAQRLGITGAPAFFVGDRFFADQQQPQVIIDTIAEILGEETDTEMTDDDTDAAASPDTEEPEATPIPEDETAQ